MKQNIVFDFNNVPAQWALCFSDNCQLASKCLRHHAAMYVPEGQERLFVINRQATDSQAGCQWFATNEPIQTAYGFKHLYDTFGIFAGFFESMILVVPVKIVKIS